MHKITTIQLILASLLAFAVGGAWYMGIFGKLWAKVIGTDNISKAEMDKLRKQMMPEMILQIAVTFLMFYVFRKLHSFSSLSMYKLAFWSWLGFTVPANISGAIFGGGTKKELIPTKILILLGGSLAPLMAGVWLLKTLAK